MKKLVRLIDQDVVASLNSGRYAEREKHPTKRFVLGLRSIYAPRITWIKLVGPLLLPAILIPLFPEPIKTYWLLACLGAIFIFFGLYFYRFALIRQRFLVKHHVDEFGACKASPDDLYEMPSD